MDGKCPSKIEWDQNLNGPRSVSCDRAITYSGFCRVRSVGPVGDFLEHDDFQPLSFCNNSVPENGRLEDYFPFGMAHFQVLCPASLRKCNYP